MNIWLVKANEPMPVVNNDQRLWRMGMLADILEKKGHEVTWFGTTFNHFSKSQMYDHDVEIEISDNYHLQIIWSPEYKKNISIKRVLNHKFLSRKFYDKAITLPKPDIVFVSFPTIDLASEAIRYGQKFNVKVIVDIRDLWPDIFSQNLPYFLKVLAKPYIWLSNVKAKKVLSQAYAITAISPPMLEWGQKKGKRNNLENDKVFFTGYSSHNNLNVQSEISLNFDKNKCTIVYCGSLTKQLNYNFLLELFKTGKKYPNIQFIICGSGGFLNELRLKVEELNLQNVVFTGWIGKSELNHIMKSSHFGLIPYRDTFDFQMSVSNKFVEYLSYSLPIIISSGGLMKSLVNTYQLGISSTIPQEILNYVKNTYNNDKMYSELKTNCFKLFEKDFQADKNYIELANYLENLGDKI